MWMPYTCLWCEKEFYARARARKHTCELKEAAEKRLGVKLATHDPITRAIAIEEAERQRRTKI